MLYRQSIILFGFVLPLVITAVIIGTGVSSKGRFTKSLAAKETQYKTFKQNQQHAMLLEAEVSKKKEHFDRWDGMLAQETASAVTMNLREIEEMLPAKEFQKTAQEHPNSGGGFASATGQSSSQVRLAFRATFRSMQKAFLELETRMPQLQLQDLRIDPSPMSNNLNVQVTYTSWEK